jgi:hypothetical protein
VELSPEARAVVVVLVGAAVVVILTELQKRRWSSGYFSVGQLLTGIDYERQPGIGAVIGKALIPFAAGVVTALLASADTVVLAALAATAGTLALTWPVFLSSEGIPPDLYGREVALRLLHVMNAATAAVLGLAGGLTASAVIVVGGEGLTQFGGDVLKNLAVEAVKAAVIFAFGAWSVRFQARRSRRIAAEAAQGSDPHRERPGES